MVHRKKSTAKPLMPPEPTRVHSTQAIWITGRGLSPLGDSGMPVLSAVVDALSPESEGPRSGLLEPMIERFLLARENRCSRRLDPAGSSNAVTFAMCEIPEKSQEHGLTTKVLRFA